MCPRTWSCSAAVMSGFEMAQAYRRFGSRVTVIQPGPQILSREDADVAAAVQACWATKASSS